LRYESTKFRANPALKPILIDRLPTKVRGQLSNFERDPELFGFLISAEGTIAPKIITRDTALLFYILSEPGLLPAYVDVGLYPARDADIKRLVSDGILEVERADGTFIHGPLALQEWNRPFYATLSHAPDFLGTLSLRAVSYGSKLQEDDPVTLADRLYRFNSLPVTSEWERLLPDSQAVMRWLAWQAGTRIGSRLARAYVRSESPVWSYWRARTALFRTEFSHKLYISPPPEALPQVFASVVETCFAHKVRSFKVGRNLRSVLRPDKLVLYFETKKLLCKATEELRERLKDVPVHGVPFTSAIDGRGLLSWGMDPPRHQALLAAGCQSWRSFVVARIATALIAARRVPGLTSYQNFALERVRLDGIDPQTWIAPEAFWKGDGKESTTVVGRTSK
jgi:hypothetical protein